MKNRDYKIFAQDNYYHVFNRGVGKMDIFKDEQDYLNFLKRLKLSLGLSINTRMTLGVQGSSLLRINPLPMNAFSILCYCLMPNHFHFLIKQNTELPIGKLISKVCTSYSMYFNKKYNHTGGVFQDQYKAVLVDSDAYLLWLSAYIHNNPKVAGFVEKLESWQWSSYPEYIGARQGTLCDKEMLLKITGSAEAYARFTLEALEKIKEKKSLEYLLLDNG